MRFFSFLLTLAFFSCNSGTGGGSSENQEIEDLRAEVLAIHDEVMPKMSALTSLQSQLSDRLKNLKSQEEIDVERVKETNKILGELNRAENAMWDWMDGFSKLDSVPNEEKVRFLMGEKISAEGMRDLMLSSMHSANEFIKANPMESNGKNEM